METRVKIVSLLCLLSVAVYGQNDIRKPPNILKPEVPETKYYTLKSNVKINCQAEGIPDPTYKWTRDGKVITPDNFINYDSQTGDLLIPEFTEREEGEYMCIASNVFDNSAGRITAASFSPPLTLYQIRMGRFTDAAELTTPATEYSYAKLSCANQGEVVANDKVYNWYLNTDTRQVNLDSGRLFIDQKGNLHFSYVKKEDATAVSYKCGYASGAEGLIVLGNSNLLTVTAVTNPQAIKPLLQYSNTGVKVNRFNSAQLECVFSGYDPISPHIPRTRWYDDAGKEIYSSNKYSLSSDSRILTIKSVDEPDERNYYCEGETNAEKSGKNAVFLDVTSAPIFVQRPADATVPENEDVVFYCDARSASGEQAPSAPVWYVNGQKTGTHTDQTKFVLSDSNKKMTIKGVKKATDILCVQCEVTNTVGTTWGDACLNVLLPITLTHIPPLRQEIEKGDDVDLTVHATTDPSQTLNYKWIFKNETYEGDNYPPHVTFDQIRQQAYINTSKLNDEEYEQIGGVYQRVIFHPYETKIVEITVVLKGVEPVPGPVAAASIDMWIIGLIIGIIFLIIVIIIIIFVICRKQQEGAYNVDKKETGAGLDPEKELKDKGFNDYSRPDYDNYDYPEKKPRGELEYDDVPIGGDDESLGEYGDEDDTHFNEDGSFIGIYQKKPAPAPQATESTI